jgi:hypothetical protein
MSLRRLYSCSHVRLVNRAFISLSFVGATGRRRKSRLHRRAANRFGYAGFVFSVSGVAADPCLMTSIEHLAYHSGATSSH